MDTYEEHVTEVSLASLSRSTLDELDCAMSDELGGGTDSSEELDTASAEDSGSAAELSGSALELDLAASAEDSGSCESSGVWGFDSLSQLAQKMLATDTKPKLKNLRMFIRPPFSLNIYKFTKKG